MKTKHRHYHRECAVLAIAVLLLSGTVFGAELPLDDQELLDLIQRKSFDYFIELGDPGTGLVPDRANNLRKNGEKTPASVAASGFALTAYAIGVERGWVSRAEALDRTRQTLRFFLEKAESHQGFFYHFVQNGTGRRVSRSELSPIDTALFLMGALFAAEYYEDAEVRSLAQRLYERVDFPWMLNGGDFFALAWSPEGGFMRGRWDHFDESILLYLLAIGSPTHAIPASTWEKIHRPVGSYRGHRLIQMPPLFTHQYPHLWIDLRDQHDGFVDYFKNSVNATLANRAFCMQQAFKYKTYGENAWGLTASEGPSGYKAYGAPPGWAVHDGTLAPTGCGTSIMFTPELSIACLRHYYETHRARIWGRYGFSDAFNLDQNWYSDQVLAIDQGALLLAIENFRSGLVWKIVKKSEPIKRAMQAVGFKPGTLELPELKPPVLEAAYLRGGIQVDGYLKDWPYGDALLLGPEHKEVGEIKDVNDLSAEIRFAWDENALYFAAKVRDDTHVFRKKGQLLWRDDLLEFFIDPETDGLRWDSPKDFQIGFRPDEDTGEGVVWSWFQGGQDPTQDGSIAVKSFVEGKSYLLEGKIRWAFLGIRPIQGLEVALSPAIHDIDMDRSEGKVVWFLKNEGEEGRFELGRVRLISPSRRKPGVTAAEADSVKT
ncbi:MAG: glucoamylase family protein [Candidatus Omnitrophota bacterium]